MAEARWLTRLKPTRRRVVTYIVVLLALLVVRLGFGAWAAWRLQGVTTRLAAVYGPLDVASLAPPRVAPADNRARILRAAASLIVLQQDVLKVNELGNLLSARGAADPAQRLVGLRRAVTENELALSVLDRAESRPGVTWEIPYREGSRASVPPLMEIRLLANLSGAASLVALADGQADEAARHVRLGLVLANSLAQERMLIIQLIRAAIERITLRPLRETLIAGEPSAAALEALAARLADAERESIGVAGLTGEMKQANSLLTEIAYGGTDFGGYARTDANPAARAVVWVIRPFMLDAQARMLDQFDGLIQYARLPAYQRPKTGPPTPEAAHGTPWWNPGASWVNTMFLMGMRRTNDSSAEDDAMKRLASTAVALRRHRLAHGGYPAALAELDASLLPDPPIDPYTGHLIEYVREGPGFTLRIEVPAYAARNVELKDMFVWTVPR